MVADPLKRLRAVPWSAAQPIAEEIVAALERILAGAAADKELDVLLRAHKELEPEARAAAAEALFGVGLWRRRLHWHVGAPKETARMLWFSLMRSLGKEVWPECMRVTGMTNEPFALRTGTPSHLADKWSVPDWLCALAERELGAEADKFLRALCAPGPIFLRTNTLRVSREALMEKLAAEEVRTLASKHARAGLLVLSDRPNFYGLQAKKDSLFEVQDEGSQLLAQLVEAGEGESVLDFCAGAGGKTLALACDVGRSGVVHAFDVDGRRLERLRTRAEQSGASNVRIHHSAPSLEVARVLVDAPCSEVGALRRGPDLRWRMKEESFAALPALQLEILTRAATCVAPGGRLVYATCTMRREENEDVALAFEAAHPQFTRTLPAWAEEFSNEQRFFKTWPHRHNTDGFFAAVWSRR